MSRGAQILIFGLFFLSAQYPLYADKFGTSFSTDSLSMEAPRPVKIKSSPMQPPQQTTASSWSPTSGTTTDFQKPLTGPSMTAATPSLTTQTPSLASPLNIKQPKITVPDFEDQFKKLTQAEQAAKMKKKKTLWESILDEVTRYGYLMIIGLVIFIVIAALRREKTPPQPLGVKTPEAPKDIWHEDF